YEFRDRAFSPGLGRWIQRDPIEYAAGERNLYRFVGNGPGNETDASGLAVCIKKISITDEGTGVGDLPPQLGVIAGKNKIAFGFRVKVEATVSGADDIRKASITQYVFRTTGVVGPRGKDFLTDATHNDEPVDRQTYKRAQAEWERNDPSYREDGRITKMFSEPQPFFSACFEWVEWSDAPPYPGELEGYGRELDASQNAAVDIDLAIKVVAKGTDDKQVTAAFRWRAFAQHDKKDDVWVWAVNPAGQGKWPDPKLPKTWE